MHYGQRYYNPELGRWVNRDPKDELCFQLLEQHPESDDEGGATLLRDLLRDLQASDPTVARAVRTFLFQLGISLDSDGCVSGYNFVGNNAPNMFDAFGLKWWWPPDWLKPKKDECCDVEAEKARVKDLAQKLNDKIADSKLPAGKVVAIAKFAKILGKLAGSVATCSELDDSCTSGPDAFLKKLDYTSCMVCAKAISGAVPEGSYPLILEMYKHCAKLK